MSSDKRERALWLADKLVGDYGSEAAQLLRYFAASHVADSPAAKNEGNAALRLLAEVADAMDLSLGDSVSVAKMRPLVLARLESAPSTTPQKPGETPRTDGILPSQSFIDETRLFDRHYYLPLIEHARQLERELAEAERMSQHNSECAIRWKRERDEFERSVASAIERIPPAVGENAKSGWVVDFKFIESVIEKAQDNYDSMSMEATEGVICALIDMGFAKMRAADGGKA